ncbi:reverse transcriptase domain-containing protein [Tanacetum coccineum]
MNRLFSNNIKATPPPASVKGIARDVFIPVGKFTFPVDFVIVDYESDRRVPLILGRPFLRITRALIDVHGEEMILPPDTSDYSLEEFADKLALIESFPLGNDDMTPEDMFADEHTLDYLSPPLWDDYDDNLFDLETVNDDVYNDPFDSKEEKI